MTGNEIGVKGAKALSEMLEENTTLTELNLSSEKEKRTEKNNKKE